MGLKEDYYIRFSIVKKAIDDFDPMYLLPDAPSDEYDIESVKVLAQISTNSTIEDIATIIMNVFSKSFSENFKVTDCIATAEKIHNELVNIRHEK